MCLYHQAVMLPISKMTYTVLGGTLNSTIPSATLKVTLVKSNGSLLPGLCPVWSVVQLSRSVPAPKLVWHLSHGTWTD